MSDPYYIYDSFDIQINVFHVPEPLKGNLSEKDKLLHQEAYLFSKDKNKPDINFPKNNIKIIDEKIYLSDTNEILLQKIAKYCTNDLQSKDIFAWIDHKPLKKSLLYTKAISINYKDLDDLYFMNPYLEKKIDDRFVSSDGAIKRNSKNYSDLYNILNSQIQNDTYNIYFCTIEDCKNYSKEIFSDSDETIIKNGYLKKYFPYHEDDHDVNLDKKIKIIDFHKSLLRDYNENPIDVRPINLVYENRDKNIIIDLFKIFQEFNVTDEVPLLRIQNDNYMDSYIKFYKEGINTSYNLNDEKKITIELFEKWNRNIYLGDEFMRPKGLDKNNSLTFILYDVKKSIFGTMVLYVNGKIKLYYGRSERLEKFNNKIMKGFLKRAADIIKIINKNLIISIPEILPSPSRIDISNIYDLSDYHLPSLTKLFSSLSTEFIVLSNEDDKLHLLYCKGENYENPRYLSDFITLCKRKKVENKAIIDLLQKRYGLNKRQSDEYLDDWVRINLTKPMRLSDDLQNISIIVEKILDRIKISLIDIKNIYQYHECIHTINGLLNVYREKRINKNKDLPEEIKDLFKKQKNIALTSRQMSFFEPEPSPQPQPEPQPELDIQTDEVVEDSEDEESDEEDDESDEEYERIDDELAGMRSNDSNDSNDDGESNYPNSRYYIKRLEMKDPRLISYKPKINRGGYSAKCQAAQDKQPIALTKDELDEIDHKTGIKNEGISYSKRQMIVGGDRPEIFYICPKYWDRKHQIPIDPRSKYHPIEKDENGEKIEWRKFVWSKDTNLDGDFFILERSGRSAGKSDSSSYWNKDKDKDNINKYHVQFIHDDVHPELLALPCCGKKEHKITKKNVFVLIQDKNETNKWQNAEIGISEEGWKKELDKLNKTGYCKISIPTIKHYKSRETYHISQMKESKGTSNRLTDQNDFPLKENKNGHVSDILKDMFHIKINSPFIREIVKAKIKMSENGFYRVGVVQDSDAFLRSLNMSHSTDINHKARGFSGIKKYIIKDLDLLNEKDTFSVGSGSFVQYFRREDKKYEKRNYDKELIKDVKENFIDYLKSDEPKDERLLIPLLMKYSENKNNKTFNGQQVNILVLHEINEKIVLIEPYGKLVVYKDKPFILVYKNDNKYESLIYYYNGKEYGYIQNLRDEEEIKENDIIYINDEIAEIITINDDNIQIRYENDASSIINKEGLIKYDMKCIYDILNNFIENCKSQVQQNKREIINMSDLNFIMTERLDYEIVNGYYDNYHKLVCIKYKNKDNKEIPIFIKPRSKSDLEFKVIPIKNIEKYQLGRCKQIYKQIDELIKEEFPDKYLSFLDKNLKILVNDFNLMIGMYMSNGFIVPLINKKYNENRSDYKTLQNSSLLSLQNNSLNSDIIKNQTDTYFKLYNEKTKDIYEIFSLLYDKIIRNDTLKRDVNKILNHQIKLLIHKRWNLLDLLKEHIELNGRNLKNIKMFIEYLCIHGLENIQKILFQNYSSLKDYKMNTISDEFIIFNMKEILTETYLDLFNKRSKFIRPISYYECTNPNISKILLKKEYIEKPVSYYTKYPNLLKKLFTGELKMYKNILSENRNDINIIANLMISIKPEITEVDIRNILINKYTEDDDSYKLQNEILDKEYDNNDGLLANIEKQNYNLSLIDYENLSEELEIGFVIFTNRYTNSDTKFQTYIKIHTELLVEDSNIKMICLYEDHTNEESDNKECKPISINDNLIHDLKTLRRNREMERIYKKTYP